MTLQEEYQSHFTYSEYGFTSMSDMAYNLPSVFFVKFDEIDGECTLYNADRRSEIDNEQKGMYSNNI